MTKTIISVTVALAAVLLSSHTAEARRWAYVTPARVVVTPRVALRPFAPVVIPTTTTYLTPTLAPNVVIGPRGHLRYVAPIQSIGVGPSYYVW